MKNKQNTIRQLSYSFIFFLLLCSGCIFQDKVPKNVIVFTLDTTRADHLGCYGYSRNTSPVIDGVAKEGARFENCVSCSAVTPVSHASIFTGLYPYNHGLRALHGTRHLTMREDVVTLAQALKDQGFSTAAFVSAFPASKYYSLDRGFTEFNQDFESADGKDVIQQDGLINTDKAQRRADATTDSALTWLKTHRKERFFVWIHYFDPHDPKLIPPVEYQVGFIPEKPDKLEYFRGLYDAEIFFMDHELGRVLEWLKREGLYKKTLIVIVSDHGEGLGDHNWWPHGILYQEQIHLVLIMRGPGIKPATIVPRVRSIDIMPTVLELIQSKTSLNMDGESFAQGFQDPRRLMDRTAYAESQSSMLYKHFTGEYSKDIMYALLQDQYKYIFKITRTEEELYDLKKDPGEKNNLAGDEKLMAREEAMRRELIKRIKVSPEPLPLDEAPAEVLDKLRSLGYIQ